MISQIHIRNFRAFAEAEVGPFSRINLITGLNNTGKTGLLEAIFVALEARPPTSKGNPIELLPNLFRVFAAQADVTENFWMWLFRDKNANNTIDIALFDEAGNVERVTLMAQGGLVPAGPLHAGLQHISNLGPFRVFRRNEPGFPLPSTAVFSAKPSDPVQDAIDYNRVILKRGKKNVEALLRQIDPRVVSIEALQTGQRPLIYADIGLPEMIPVTHLGEGFCRLLDIYSELLAGEAKVLLVDEIENGLHHTVMPLVWRGLMAAAKNLDVQIFATTHSAECIFAAYEVAKEMEPYELTLMRLDRVTDHVKATVIDGEALTTARELNWELR